MDRRWHIVSIVSVMLFIWTLSAQPGIRDYIEQVKRQPGAVDTFGFPEADAVSVFAPVQQSIPVFLPAGTVPHDTLMDRIREEAEKRRIAPIDARLDRIWKAIPGYNGLEVDVEKTFRLALQRGDKEISFVLREVPPHVSLNDLGAQPVYKGNPEKRMVSLMINVAWGEEFLPSMIDILNKENVRATFFFDGSWLKKNMDTARAIGEEGHELSNHAYSHPNMSKLGPARQKEEISKTEALLGQLGVKNKLFAPPSGDYNEQTVQLAHQMGLTTVLWTIDTVDWQNPPADSVIRKIASRVEPGAMILMHPTKTTRDALLPMIKVIKKKSLALGTVSELLSSDRVPPAGTAPVQETGIGN